jgi:hypothetical protein
VDNTSEGKMIKRIVFFSFIFLLIAIGDVFASDITVRIKQTIDHKGFSLRDHYSFFSGEGIEYDLTKVIATVSSFTWDNDKRHKFAFNVERELNLDLDVDEIVSEVPAIPTTAICVALEVCPKDEQVGVPKPRRLLTKLDAFMFDFEEPSKPSAITLIVRMNEEGLVDMEAKLTGLGPLVNIYPAFAKLRPEKDLELLSKHNAIIVTRHAAATSSSTFNQAWEEILNYRGK